MKRVFSTIFFLFFIVAQLSPLYAQTSAPPAPTVPAPSPAPGTDLENMPPILGVNCGIEGKKCCFSEKQDTGLIASLNETASKMPVIGNLFTTYSQAVTRNTISNVMSACDKGSTPSLSDTSNKDCICIKDTKEIADIDLNFFCKNYFELSPGQTQKELQQCAQCMVNNKGFYTAFGCIPLNLSTLITSYILTTGIGIAGGIALLCILYSAFMMQTSMGNPEAIKKAQENLTACITGLVIIIFSVLILKIIGVDILRIPGIGK